MITHRPARCLNNLLPCPQSTVLGPKGLTPRGLEKSQVDVTDVLVVIVVPIVLIGVIVVRSVEQLTVICIA